MRLRWLKEARLHLEKFAQPSVCARRGSCKANSFPSGKTPVSASGGAPKEIHLNSGLIGALGSGGIAPVPRHSAHHAILGSEFA